MGLKSRKLILQMGRGLTVPLLGTKLTDLKKNAGMNKGVRGKTLGGAKKIIVWLPGRR